VLEHVERIIAIELMVGAQALDLRLASADAAGAGPGAGVAEAHRLIRSRIGHLDRDREPGPDLAAATDLVRSGVLAPLAGGPTGGR
jgi:histidine ammonia-lyase